jgi:hypothetical protein
VPPNIATLANKFVTGLPVSKFWTVNLSTDGVPLVGGTGVVYIIFPIYPTFGTICAILTMGYMQKNERQHYQKQCATH